MIFSIDHFCIKFQIDNSKPNTALDPVFNEFENITHYGMLHKIIINCYFQYMVHNVEILQLRAKFQTAMVSCSKCIWITNFSDHRKV